MIGPRVLLGVLLLVLPRNRGLQSVGPVPSFDAHWLLVLLGLSTRVLVPFLECVLLGERNGVLRLRTPGLGVSVQYPCMKAWHTWYQWAPQGCGCVNCCWVRRSSVNLRRCVAGSLALLRSIDSNT